MTEKGTLHLNKQRKLRQLYIDKYLRWTTDSIDIH
jgi:hypothetical protein